MDASKTELKFTFRFQKSHMYKFIRNVFIILLFWPQNVTKPKFTILHGETEKNQGK